MLNKLRRNLKDTINYRPTRPTRPSHEKNIRGVSKRRITQGKLKIQYTFPKTKLKHKYKQLDLLRYSAVQSPFGG